MNPKEKAKQLLEKFKLGQLKTFDHHSDMYTYVDKNKYAKECAILCVNEILDQTLPGSPYEEVRRDRQYWEDVMTELKID